MIPEFEDPTVVEIQLPPVVVELPGGLRGPSAYEQAVRGGFTGTLEEFTGLLRSYSAAVLSSNCLVCITGTGLVRSDAATRIPVQGLVRAAASIGDECVITRSGRINGFSGLSPGDTIFLGAAGQITQTLPSVGMHQELGVAVSSDTIALDITPPIYI